MPSKWIKTKDKAYSNFYWQDGYGIFSINLMETDLVIDYIEKQHDHHEHNGFQEEFLNFPNKYNIGYDELYVWD
jgi:hypothetical protein